MWMFTSLLCLIDGKATYGILAYKVIKAYFFV